MSRILLLLGLALAACTPAPQKAAMPDTNPVTTDAARSSDDVAQPTQASGAPAPTGRRGPDHGGDAIVPISASVSATTKGSGPAGDSSAEAKGRRTLSTAYVMVGPDGHLTVERHDGGVLVLRDVVLGPRDYCGLHAAGDTAGTRYCGGYAEVAAARPGGAPGRDQPISEAPGPPAPRRDGAKPK